MNTEYMKQCLMEAKHSYRVLIQHIGSLDSHANIVLLKWPDVLESFLSNNKEKLSEDLAYVVCMPIRILAEALYEMFSLEQKQKGDVKKSHDDILDIMKAAYKDPISAKQNLINICNVQIYKLNNLGHEFRNIKEMKNDRDFDRCEKL